MSKNNRIAFVEISWPRFGLRVLHGFLYHNASNVAVSVLVIGLICLAPYVAAFLTDVGMIVDVLSLNIRSFVGISDNLY